MVGAERFELPTPCAQGGFRRPPKSVFFQWLLFQCDAANLLQRVELGCIRRLGHPHFYLQRYSGYPVKPQIELDVAEEVVYKAQLEEHLARKRFLRFLENAKSPPGRRRATSASRASSSWTC